jgi:tetratricopeptide (TPR) repeat protein
VALARYQEALRLRDDLPLAYYYLGVTYGQLGRLDLALRNFQKTLTLDPRFRNTRELLDQVKVALAGR